MRTTITLDADVAAAVEQLRRNRSIGVSEAVNDLIRAGLVKERERTTFVQKTAAMHARIDLTNVAEALEILEGHDYR